MLLLLLSLAHAGGITFSWQITDATVSGGVHTFTMRPTEADSFSACEAVTIRAAYGWRSWYNSLLHRFPSSSETTEALDHLHAQHRAGAVVAFGFMGTEWGAHADPCVFESRGMMLHNAPEPAVLSFFNPI